MKKCAALAGRAARSWPAGGGAPSSLRSFARRASAGRWPRRGARCGLRRALAALEQRIGRWGWTDAAAARRRAAALEQLAEAHWRSVAASDARRAYRAYRLSATPRPARARRSSCFAETLLAALRAMPCRAARAAKTSQPSRCSYALADASDALAAAAVDRTTLDSRLGGDRGDGPQAALRAD